MKNIRLKTDRHGKIIYLHRRLEKVSALCKERRIESLKNVTVNIPDDIHRLFSLDIAVDGLHVFMGYVTDAVASYTGQPSHVKGPILTFASLDAFVFTMVSRVSLNERDITNGHRQKVFHDTSGNLLSNAVNQLVGTLTTCVPTWTPYDFEPVVSRRNSQVSVSTDPESTMKVHYFQTGRQLLAVKAN